MKKITQQVKTGAADLRRIRKQSSETKASYRKQSHYGKKCKLAPTTFEKRGKQMRGKQ